MKRDLYKQLLEWKSAQWRKPLILQGARQVGKTYILKKFGEKEFQSCVYFNFEKDPTLADFFVGRIEPTRILEKLSIYSEQTIHPGSSLIIFDEIQACPEALKSLKYFNEETNQYHIAAAGSLLGVKIGQSAPFPVGKVNFMNLYPLSFLEFIEGIGEGQHRSYLESIKTCAPLPEPFHNRLSELLKFYFYIGGMPEAVVIYKESADLKKVRRVQNEILKGYENDFSKYASRSEAIRISALWKSIPSQLAKENKKFMYAEVAKSARAREYSGALRWLCDAGLIIKSQRLKTVQIPLTAFSEEEHFKLYLLDTGLLAAKLNLAAKTIVLKNELFDQFFGAFTENFVAQDLVANGFQSLFYWSIPHKAEVDFIVPYQDDVYPLEVKSGTTVKTKSLRNYQKETKCSVVCTASPRNLTKDQDYCNFPLYAVAKFPELVRDL